MGEIIRFASKSERERIRLILEARAIYDSVFPSAAPVNVRGDEAPGTDGIGAASADRSDGVFS
jgi:hypothetical protein